MPRVARSAGAGKSKGKAPPPPPIDDADGPLGPEDFAAMTPVALVRDAMSLLRTNGSGTLGRAVIVGLFQRLDALLAMLTNTADPSLLTPIQKLTSDLKQASRTLGKNEARFLVDAYYQMQENRIRTKHQVSTLAEPKKVDDEEDAEVKVPEPHDVLAWLFGQEETLEKQIRGALDIYGLSDPTGVWARSVKGIGPVIAAGLLANIDITRAPTVGHIWRFAGLDPTSLWHGTARATSMVDGVIKELGIKPSEITDQAIERIASLINVSGIRLFDRLEDKSHTRANVIAAVAKRPWNASLKRLCFLIGESFVKVSNRPDDVYGKLYKSRKEWETERNSRQLYADQAKHSLETKNFGRDTEAYKWYSQGMLPPARIHLRAQRRAVKLFLAHFHEVLHWHEYGTLPPNPYVFDHVPGHVHRLDIPNLDLLVPELLEAKEKAQRGRGRQARER